MADDGRPNEPAAKPPYDGPPDYRCVGRHAVFPDISHDEAARFNFLAHLNRHLSTRVLPGVAEAFRARVEPAFEAKQGRGFRDRHEVRRALTQEPIYRWWSGLRRAAMETRQQAGRWAALRQAEALNAAAAALTAADPRLELDPAFVLPKSVASIDHHCMPGSYHSEHVPGDVTGPANYDAGIFATTGGMLGRYNDGGGEAVARFVRRRFPDFAPRRILDLGAGLGHNVAPIAEAFPEAEVIALDAAAPMLRYGLARAKSLGVENVRFVQGDAADLSRFPDASFDWVQTTMFLHETSHASMPKIFAESFRVLRPGGLALHVEQPQYAPGMPLLEQALRDWDAFYNNEPYWTKMHEVDLDAWLERAGFARADILHGQVAAAVDKTVFPDAAEDDSEDYGRKAAWHVVGARKPGAAP